MPKAVKNRISSNDRIFIKNAGKLISAEIISETDADMYMNISIFYDTCEYCDYIISWNTVSAFFPAYYLIFHLFCYVLMQIVQ